MSPAESSALLQWFVDHFATSDSHPDGSVLGGIVYEMFGLQDAFGQVMVRNLKVGTPTLTLFSRDVTWM
jgi:[phosphatase 2A protein]-leucine-carboxy methyltransferase